MVPDMTEPGSADTRCEAFAATVACCPRKVTLRVPGGALSMTWEQHAWPGAARVVIQPGWSAHNWLIRTRPRTGGAAVRRAYSAGSMRPSKGYVATAAAT